MTDKESSKQTGAELPTVIKKYANRRLYNTATSSYVTLDHLCQMVKEGEDFVVYDAKTGEDITRSVLTQIIFEEETKGQNLLPIKFLRQLIGFYGNSLQGLVPNYLEMSMESFTRNQDQIRHYMKDAFGDMSPFKQIEEMGRQNLAMLQNAMGIFNPFVPPQPNQRPTQQSTGTTPRDKEERGEGELDQLKHRLEALQRQLDELAGKKKS